MVLRLQLGLVLLFTSQLGGFRSAHRWFFGSVAAFPCAFGVVDACCGKGAAAGDSGVLLVPPFLPVGPAAGEEEVEEAAAGLTPAPGSPPAGSRRL